MQQVLSLYPFCKSDLPTAIPEMNIRAGHISVYQRIQLNVY